jgi:hypothetical protein
LSFTQSLKVLSIFDPTGTVTFEKDNSAQQGLQIAGYGI